MGHISLYLGGRGREGGREREGEREGGRGARGGEGREGGREGGEGREIVKAARRIVRKLHVLHKRKCFNT